MIIVNDVCSYRVSRDTQREYTSEGYLKVPARFARCGIYKYKASELGIHDVSPNTIVRVYRPPEEVFKPEALASFRGAVVTDEHPRELVDSSNYKNYDLGTVMSEGEKDGDYVKGELLIRDAEAIRKIESGKEELSAGYGATYDYDVVNGQIVAGDYTVDEAGTVKRAVSTYGEYDVIQRDIKINHVALVASGRAGREVRVFDNSVNGRNQIMQTITLDSGARVDVTADNAEHIVAHVQNLQSTIDSMSETMDAMKKEMKEMKKKSEDDDEEMEKLKAKSDAKDEEMEKMKKKTCDAAIKEHVDSVIKLTQDCKMVAGDAFTCDSTDIMSIKRAALKVVNDSVDWADKSDSYCEARFDIAVEDAQKADKEAATYDHQLKNLVGDKGVVTQDSGEVVTSRAQDRLNQINGGK